MSKFKVGDVVSVDKYLETFVPKKGSWVPSMDKFDGIPMVIEHIDEVDGSFNSNGWWFRLERAKHFVSKPQSHKISPHYTTDSTGKDYLQRFFENSTPEEIKGAMVFTIGKYIDRLGKKDAPEKELAKIIDYATRYRDFLNK